MEDAMILNKSSVERGFAHATVYKSEVIIKANACLRISSLVAKFLGYLYSVYFVLDNQFERKIYRWNGNIWYKYLSDKIQIFVY